MPIENKGAAAGAEDPKDLNGADNGANAGAGADNKDGKPDGDGSGDGDEEVTVKKSELERLKKQEEDNENYQKALGIGKYKKSKSDRSVDTPAAPDGKKDTDKSQFVTKSEQYKTNQKQAIKLATTVAKDDEPEVIALKKDLDDNWDDIKAFYTGRRGQNTPEDIMEDLFDAHAVWARNKAKKAQNSDDKETKANLAADRGQGGKGNNAAAGTQRKTLIPKNVKPTDWYPTKK